VAPQWVAAAVALLGVLLALGMLMRYRVQGRTLA
jgi:hypothetical protein